jgi:hypothetical protein
VYFVVRHKKKISKTTKSIHSKKKKSSSHKHKKKTHIEKALEVPKSDIKQQAGKWLWLTSIVIVLIIAYAAYNAKQTIQPLSIGSGNTNINLASSGEQVKLDFYVMSQCPYGTQVEDAIAPVLEKIGGDIDFNLHFIVTENPDGTFKSLHGQPEVEGNIAQLCAIKYNPVKYMDMIVCQNKNAGSIPGNWESCAQSNGLAVDKIKSCYTGDEGKDLLRASITETNKVGATGSPTIYLNDQKYAGGRQENDFLRAICNSFENDKPQACSDIPEPVKVEILLINDERCETCDVSQLIGQLKGIFPGMVVESLDYNSAKGKELFLASSITHLPALLFDSTVEKAESYANVQRYLLPAGEYTSLMIGASFDPTAEICTNNKDDTGNGKVDCDDDTCKGTMECREEIENNLQVFIMSDCPYGRKAIVALKEVVDNFDTMDYEVHYIASETPEGFNSLHGQYEVDENIVQLCVNEHSPAVWFDYIYCRSDKGVRGIDWKTCAGETGVNVDAVQTCFDGDEGKNLFREDIKIANSLGIGASPTWLANNKFQFSGIDAENIKTSFCQQNLELAGCENTLSSDTGGVAAGTC